MRRDTLWLVIFLLIIPLYFPLDFHSPQWVIWNVGQGQWTTFFNGKECLHFDMGGERAPWERVKALCQIQDNKIYLSHEDKDHISFIQRASLHLKKICLAKRGLDKHNQTAKRKEKILSAVPLCSSPIYPSEVKEISLSKRFLNSLKLKDTNSKSRIFILGGQLLSPGDSTRKAEKHWMHQIPFRSIEFLIAGHHGSYTSSGQELLDRLPRLKMIFVSARKKRYGHPHPQVVQRWRQNQIPFLQTELWGHLHIPFKKNPDP